MTETFIKEDDYFRVGDEVIVNRFDNDMNGNVKSWIVGQPAKVVAIANRRNSPYCIMFDKEMAGLWGGGNVNGDIGAKLPKKANLYQEVGRRSLTKVELPKFRSVEREAEYFREEYLKLRGKSLQMIDELRSKKENEIVKLQSQIDNVVAFPENAIEWHKAGFILTRVGEYNFYTIMQKRSITIDNFVCDKFSVKLPENLIFKSSLFLACNFRGKDFVGYGVYTPKFTPFVSFHTAIDDSGLSRVCIGDLKTKPKLELKSISMALDEYQNVLTTINPYSYLNHHFSNGVRYQKKLREIHKHVSDYHREYYAKHQICPECNKNGEQCECDRCENCNRNYDDCECNRCENCDNRVDSTCSNGYCENCCDCDHCPSCSESYEGWCDTCEMGVSCGCCHCEENKKK
jgi:protocadherin alpha